MPSEPCFVLFGFLIVLLVLRAGGAPFHSCPTLLASRCSTREGGAVSPLRPPRSSINCFSTPVFHEQRRTNNQLRTPDRFEITCQAFTHHTSPQNIQRTRNILLIKTSEITPQFDIMCSDRVPSNGALTGRRSYFVPYPSRPQLAIGWGI